LDVVVECGELVLKGNFLGDGGGALGLEVDDLVAHVIEVGVLLRVHLLAVDAELGDLLGEVKLDLAEQLEHPGHALSAGASVAAGTLEQAGGLLQGRQRGGVRGLLGGTLEQGEGAVEPIGV